jgi:hypothetical protein
MSIWSIVLPIAGAMIGGPAGAAAGGALAGAATSKKPLQGALLGAATGYAGGLLAPAAAAGSGAAAAAGSGAATGAAAEGAAAGAGNGMSGLLSDPAGNYAAASQYGTNMGSQQTAMLAAQDAALNGGTKTAGLMGTMKPLGSAMATAQQVNSMFGPSQQQQGIVASPISQTPNTGPGGLTSLVQENNNVASNIKAENDAKKQRRLQQLAGMRGY